MALLYLYQMGQEAPIIALSVSALLLPILAEEIIVLLVMRLSRIIRQERITLD